ncbi:MAG: protein phosphatase 2C domain-containing protein [Deltaproteobacteria bacterium]|nr:protein phosphatase 2C domain-containing protein [Deltaproteobacteria bacterium]
MRSAFLRGRNQHRIGGLELVGEGPTAIALSRGGARKTYSHTDPNEDCVAFATGEGGQLVVATDGHHGELGSEAAVQTILDEFAEPWTARNAPILDPADWSRLGLEALARANRAILEVAGRYQLPPAPTTFALALVRPAEDLLLHLSVGDSHVFAVDRGEALELGGRDSDWKFTPFLGYEEASAELLEKFSVIGQRGLEGLRAIILATDGLSEPGIGVEDPAQSVFATVSQIEFDAPPDRRAVDTCRHITEIALRSHRQQKAGDNIGCSVIWLGD